MRGLATMRSIAMVAMLAMGVVVEGVQPARADAVRADLLTDARVAMQRFDYKTAVELVRPLAEGGIAEAQGDLGWMYSVGKGVEKNCEQALKWLRLAVAQGNPASQEVLGAMYKRGDCVPQDYKEALMWLRLSAEQGYFPAQYFIGQMYKDGKGIPQDYVHAHMWFNLAVSTSFGALGRIGRDDVATKMNSTQIEEAEKMATRCQQSNFKDCG